MVDGLVVCLYRLNMSNTKTVHAVSLVSGRAMEIRFTASTPTIERRPEGYRLATEVK